MAMAHILINCNSGSKNQVISELKKFDSIQDAREVDGAFDVVAKLESSTLQELRDIISEDIRKIKNIISTVTLMNSDSFS